MICRVIACNYRLCEIILKYSARVPDKNAGDIMLGPIGSEVMAIFRLLSPHEIDAYITEEEASVVRIEGSRTATGEELSHDSSKQFYQKADPEQVADLDDTDEIDVKKPAKIIPLHAYQEQKQQPEERPSKQHSRPTGGSKSSGLDSLGILSASQIKEQEQERLKQERNKEDSVTVFLLKERQKMRQSKQRLTEQTAIKLYQTNAAVDLHMEETVDEDGETLASSDMRGILVNKKQF